MKIPDNIYMNICKVFQELYKNKFVPNELNIAEVGSRGKNMTCRYRITVPEEMESVTFSYYDAVVYDAVYTLYRANCSKFALTDLLRVMSGDEKVRFYSTKGRIQKREQRLRDSLEKLRNTTIAIDYSEEVLASEVSAPRARAVLIMTWPRRQISPPVRNAFAIFRGRLWVGVSCLTYCSYFFSSILRI